MSGEAQPELLAAVVEEANVGIVVVDQDYTVVVWNRFMAAHSGQTADAVRGRNLFDARPELPHRWLATKLRSVFMLGSQAFTSWEQRPYLFRFRHNRSATEDLDWMRQDCTLTPILGPAGEVTHVCITVQDVTDTSLYQMRLEASYERIEAVSIRDGLTGVYNRRHIETLLRQEIVRLQRHGGELAAIIFDLDRFKAINDAYGHRAGDDVLCEVVRRVEETLRENDHLGRYGGEEFVVALPDTGSEGAVQAAERIRRAINAAPVEADARAIRVSATFGVASWRSGEALDVFLDRADQALYRGKEAGRDRVVSAEQPVQ